MDDSLWLLYQEIKVLFASKNLSSELEEDIKAGHVEQFSSSEEMFKSLGI